MRFYEDRDLYIEWEIAEIPWIKIFAAEHYKEITDCPADLRQKLWRVYEIAERSMIEYYKPHKINMASFGNYLPRVHIHVMARFENDSYFPEPMWGEKRRDGSYEMPDRESFERLLIARIKEMS